MRRRIVTSLFALFVFVCMGALTAVVYMSDITAELNHLIELHEIEQLRRSLVIQLQSVQSNLYTVNTPYAHDLDSIVENVNKAIETADKCTSCHHPPKLNNRIIRIKSMVQDFERNLSYFITTRAKSERLENLKKEVVSLSNKLIAQAENMSHSATSSLDKRSAEAMVKIKNIKSILLATVVITFFLGGIVAVRLIKSVIKPVNALVKATRMISSGKLGYTISYKDDTEFGELAEHFNNMSKVIKDGVDKIQEEVAERWQAEQALSKSEKILGSMFDSVVDPFCIIDKEYKIVRANEAYAKIKNRSIEDLVDQRCYEILHNRKEICEDCVVVKTFKSSDPCAKDKLLVNDDESQTWLEIYTYPISAADGDIMYVLEYTRDITDRKRTEEALKASEERYALAARGANDGLWDWDMKLNTVYYSPRWKSMLGFNEKEVKDSPDEWLDRIHADDRMNVEKEIAAHVNNHTPHFKNEHRIMHRNGSYRWVLSRGIVVRDKSGKACRIAGSITDITDRKRAEEQLIYDALHDSLTNLPNRVLFMDRLEHSISREIRRGKYLFAVLFLDMNRFKVLNDSLGHTIGDQLLIAVGHRLSECLRPGDTVARLGGDEFAILLEDLQSESEAISIAERIEDQLSLPFQINNREVFTSVSIGIALSNTGFDQPEHLLRNADIAMYHAKADRRSSCYKVFDTGMYSNAVARLELETDLRQAINQEEFVLHYQPIVSTQNGRITGLEALVRWHHPHHGLILPSKFIPIAEETGLIVDLGKWVLLEACRQLSVLQREFPSNPPLTVSVNISSKQLVPGLIEQIKQILDETNIEPESLILEITESMIMENAHTVAPLLRQLKDMNIKLYVDDFGTGYSSLSYLQHFPIDVLKIDRSFVMRMGYKEDNLEIVKAIATLAHSLGMNVVAEGVETAEQISHLISLKCEYIQGYFFSRPLDDKGIISLLRQGKFDVNSYLTNVSAVG